jgi:glycosyltransferase involved in cell wall biosynthesis
MDVLVCGAQVPFSAGGAELHMDNLVAAVRAAGHRCELVRLPVAWEKGRLFDAPIAWRLVPLDADIIIATNFPSYYARHAHKVVWLFHQHRGAYDAADAPWSDFGLDDASLETQRLLTEWDSRALGEAQRLFTTSGVVADRLARYNGLTGTPLYHPPPLADQLHEGPFGDYVFCPSRLAANKRPELLLEAIGASQTSTRGILAGRGPLRDDLAVRADKLEIRDRIQFAGFVPDAEIVELYADALAILYAPLDEDYGYVTLQAFFAGKPVITATDSGGVLEWVEDGVTGLVTDGSPKALGAAVGRLAADRQFAERLGAAGRERVRHLAWPPVVKCLLS